MKLGVKTFDSESFLKHFENLSDFFEIQAIQTNNYDFLKKFSKPIVIHAEHMGFRINPADKSLYNKNLQSINFARNLAEKTNAKKIIFHPGHFLNDNCSKEQSFYFIKELNDKRIIVENLSEYHKGLCTKPEEIKELMKFAGVGFCFDINHAIQNAMFQDIEYLKILEEFVKLKPSHYHIGGQKLKNGDGGHKCFKDSEINLKEILKLLPKNAEITLEVTTDIEKTKDDLRIIRELIKELDK